MARIAGGPQLGRPLAEGVMVVASIRAAFAPDAWWAQGETGSEMLPEVGSVRQEPELPLLSASRDFERFARMDAALIDGEAVYTKPVPRFGIMDDPNALQIPNLIRIRASWYISGPGKTRSLLEHIDGLLASLE